MTKIVNGVLRIHVSKYECPVKPDDTTRRVLACKHDVNQPCTLDDIEHQLQLVIFTIPIPYVLEISMILFPFYMEISTLVMCG